jgi:transcriptional regulator with XRE-family HTH domain
MGVLDLKPEKAFALVLRELRNQNNISQEKLAHSSGLDRTFISLLERGLRQPSLKSILQLSESLNVSASEMMGLVEKRLKSKKK